MELIDYVITQYSSINMVSKTKKTYNVSVVNIKA